jgi:serine/threonine protein kinase
MADRSMHDFYRIGDIIGGGAFSIVKRGTSLLNNEVVAIKVMKKGGYSQDTRESVLREVMVLQSLNHKNIINFRDFFEESDNSYIIMEYLDG